MRLNVQTDYALRLLMHVAVNTDRLCTIADVSEHFNISKNHLMKVALTCRKAGWINAERGRGGGLTLAVAPQSIRLGTVIESMESAALVECLQEGGGNCIVTPVCRLKGVLNEALNAFFAVLNKYSLADLVEGNRGLHQILNMEVA